MGRVNIDRVAGRKESERKTKMKWGSEVTIAMKQYKRSKKQTRQIWRKETDES
jgi:hypothetical protein